MKTNRLLLISLTTTVATMTACAVSFPDFIPVDDFASGGGSPGSTGPSGGNGDGGMSQSSTSITSTSMSSTSTSASATTSSTTASGPTGSGGAGGAGTGGAGGEGGGVVVPVATCDEYCAQIATVCSGSDQEYIAGESCSTFCGKLKTGNATDTTGDTLGCRVNQLKKAIAHPEIYCQQAGPLGGGACNGTDVCDAYCNLAFPLCADATPPPYTTRAGCLSDCQGVAYLQTRDPMSAADAGGPVGDVNNQFGRTLNCKLYHMEAAFAAPPQSLAHCEHLATDGAWCHDM